MCLFHTTEQETGGAAGGATSEATPPVSNAPLLAKLFPQTSPEVDSTAEQERQKREEEEAKENERAWKRMKLG